MSLTIARRVSRKLRSTVMYVASFALVLGSVSSAVPLFMTQQANALDAEGVSTSLDLKNALANPEVQSITLGSDITTSEKLVLSHPAIINGNNKKITFTGDSAGWQGNYVLQVYNTNNVTIKGLKLAGGDAAMLVNGSRVTLDGSIDVSGNAFGGIEVSNGSYTAQNAYLGSPYNILNTTETYAKPTVWTDGANATFNDVSRTMLLATHVRANQNQYYLNAENTGTVATNSTQHKTYALLQDAFDAASLNDTILLNKNVVINGKAAVINTAVNFDGQMKTIQTTNPRGDETLQLNAALIVTATGTNVSNLTVEGTGLTNLGNSSHGLIVYGATKVTLTNIMAKNNAAGIIVDRSQVSAVNIATTGNTWLYGIDVDKTNATLSISGVNSNTEPAAIFVDERNVGTVIDVDFKYTKITTPGTADYYVLDRTGPAVSFQIAPPAVAAGTINVRPIALGEADGSMILKQLYIDGSSSPIRELNSTHRNYDISVDTTLLTEGTHTMKFVATDAPGNSSTVSAAFIVDNKSPVITIDGVTVKAVYNLTDNMQVYASDANYKNTIIKQYNSDGTTFTGWEKVYTDSYFGVTWLPDGKYQIQSFDVVNNKTVAYDITVDRTAPAAPTVTFNKSSMDNPTGSWTPKVDAGDAISYHWTADGSNPKGLTFTATDKEPTFTPASKAYGVYAFSLVATDAAGNSSAAADFSFTYAAPEVVTHVLPTTDPNAKVALPAPLTQNLAAFAATPTATNDTAVLGASTTKDATAVLASTTKKVAAIDSNASSANWYWLLAVPAVAGAGWWATAAARRRNS